MINEIKIMLLIHLRYYYQRTASISMQLDQHAGEAFQSVKCFSQTRQNGYVFSQNIQKSHW